MRAIIYIIDAVATLVVLILLLRFWLPWFGADFRNPIAQGILRVTSPLVNPLRRIVPSIGRVDTATVLAAFSVQALAIVATSLLNSSPVTAKYVIVMAVFLLAFWTIRLLTIAIVVRILLSWFAPQTHNPATALLATLTEPILRPFRRFIPTIGGFDISPVVAIILLGASSVALQDTVSLYLLG